MKAVRTMHGTVSLNKALLLCGVSEKAWYYTARSRNVSPDPEVQEMIQKIGPARPTYGTRRMAAQASRELNRPVNGKAVRRIFKRLGWSEPSRTKREIIRANKKSPQAKGAEPVLGIRHVLHLVRIRRPGLLLQRDRRLHQAAAGFVLASRATRREAIMSVTNAVAAAGPELPGLTLRVDSGSQYTSREFRSSVAALGITLEYIYANTPEQNGHIESFHRTLKKEYVWPREFADIQEAREAMLAAFEDYNRRRIHSAPRFLTPSEFAGQYRQGSEGGIPGIEGGGNCE